MSTVPAGIRGLSIANDLATILAANRGRQFELHQRYINPKFRQMLHLVGLDIDYVEAEGIWLKDADGRQYRDFLTHSGVFSLGHNHPQVNAALRGVLSARLPNVLLMDCSLLSGLLAERLLAKAPHLGKAWFGNSGAEAVEAALKFARAATGRPRIVSFTGGYHGLTYGALSVVGHPMWREGFAPFLPACVQVPFNDLEAVQRELARGDVAAVLGETIQGDGGVRLPRPGFWAGVETVCRRVGTLLILDEIQVGLGRTGSFFAYQTEGITPDLVLLAKGLSGGQMPVSVVLMSDRVCDGVFSRIDRCVIHSGTYNENNLSMVAALATLEVLEHEDLVRRASEMGEYFLNRLRAMASKYEMVAEVRGRGLIVGIEFGRPQSFALRMAWDAVTAANEGLIAQMIAAPLCREQGILAQLAGHDFRTLKLMPPLIVSREDIDACVTALDVVLGQAHRYPSPAWDYVGELAGRALG